MNRLPRIGLTALAALACSALMLTSAMAAPQPQTTAQTKRATPQKSVEQLSHIVRPGETLSGLARYYGCSVADLQALNGLSGETIALGTRLAVPWPDIRLRTAPRINVSRHTVIVGESLGTIATRYDSDVRSIRLLNRLPNDKIRIGQRLKVPSAAPALKRVIDRTKVKAGDSLRTIAARYGMQQRQLKHFNPGTDWAALRIGQTVKIVRYERVVPAPIKRARPAGARTAPMKAAAPPAKKATAPPTKARPCPCTCHDKQAKAPKNVPAPLVDDDFAYRD